MDTAKLNMLFYDYISSDERSPKDMAIFLVNCDGLSLEHHITHQNDKDVVMAAVAQNGCALRYASNALCADRDVVMAAVAQNRHAVRYASEELRNDKEIMLAAVTQYGPSLRYASKELCADREVVMAAIAQDSASLKYADEYFRNNKEVVLAAVKNYGPVLQYASKELRNNRGIVLAAVTRDGGALLYASEMLRKDEELIDIASKTKKDVVYVLIENGVKIPFNVVIKNINTRLSLYYVLRKYNNAAMRKKIILETAAVFNERLYVAVKTIAQCGLPDPIEHMLINLVIEDYYY